MTSALQDAATRDLAAERGRTGALEARLSEVSESFHGTDVKLAHLEAAEARLRDDKRALLLDKQALEEERRVQVWSKCALARVGCRSRLGLDIVLRSSKL